ncbi:unnamed protein product [Mytilus coruscus]|uniref:Uncharacterized protein n=1 Tax=Mytilus coruscus TaxID=42192 RepID=A0A6J8E723_MYTCO|nr:unnamed protein product [Mytilus coruscus]
MQINTHLDKLKEEILKELEQAFYSNNDAIQTVISSLNVNEKEIKYYRTELQNIKKYASDLQSFLGMREIQEKANDNEKRLKSMIKNKHFENVDIQLSIDDKICDILTTAKTFGSIIIKKSPSANTKMASRKTRQAQITVPSRMQIINTISVEFKQTISTRCSILRGCSMTRKGWFIFTDACSDNDKLVVLNAKGKTECVIKLSFRFGAFDVVCLNDRTVAFTNASQKKKPGISIIDLNTREITDSVDLPHHSYGIIHDGSSLFCCVDDDVRVISCTDYSITTIPNTTTDQHSYISTHAGKIWSEDTVIVL